MFVKAIWIPGALGALLALAALAPLASGAAGTATRTVATSQTLDFRVAVLATKVSGGQAPTASASVEVFRRSRGHWQKFLVARVPGGYFWKVLTGLGSVCRLEISTSSGRSPGGHVTISLLQSPSLGCGPPMTLLLSNRGG
jgi:hypothetical protein